MLAPGVMKALLWTALALNGRERTALRKVYRRADSRSQGESDGVPVFASSAVHMPALAESGSVCLPVGNPTLQVLKNCMRLHSIK